jgi:hypothetical protein
VAGMPAAVPLSGQSGITPGLTSAKLSRIGVTVWCRPWPSKQRSDIAGPPASTEDVGVDEAGMVGDGIVKGSKDHSQLPRRLAWHGADDTFEHIAIIRWRRATRWLAAAGPRQGRLPAMRGAGYGRPSRERAGHCAGTEPGPFQLDHLSLRGSRETADLRVTAPGRVEDVAARAQL